MDKNILKKFAVESRKLLEEKVADRINSYYVNEDFDEDKSGEVVNMTNAKHNLILTKEEYEYRFILKKRIEKYDKEYGDGLSHVIKEAAFTWFNRIVCLRYMELHDFLPLTKEKESLNIRVLSIRENEAEPEIMKSANLHNPELDIKINHEKLDKIININDRYEYVLLNVCEKMGEVLPQIFDGETDYIELLIPKNLLNADSFLDKLIKEVPEDNFNDIEIIGWFYQYYNQSEKDKAMKEKRAYKKNEIPYVTQIFTPDWIVKYMVENSLGRLWVEKNGDEEIIKDFKYFIKDNIEIDNKGVLPENISFIDPCMGSGHILIYAFEVFMKLYQNAGYNKKDIPELILKNNLYGLDIDDRAGQFAIISVMLKAREYDKDIFNKIDFDKLNILSIKETDTEYLQWTQSIKDADIRKTIEYLIETFKNAKEIGSLLIVEDRDYKKVEDYLNKASDTVFNMLLRNNLKDVIRVAKILSKKYDVVVTNPPYLSLSKMEEDIKPYIEYYYKDSKADLCTAFMEIKLVDNDRYLGMINMHSWMFLMFEELRKKVINNNHIISMLHLGAHAFEGMGGEVLQTTAFIMKANVVDLKKSIYIRLVNELDPDIKKQKFEKILAQDIEKSDLCYVVDKNKFNSIPDYVIAYWLSDNMIKCFEDGKALAENYRTAQGLATGKNELFVREWFEVSTEKLKLDAKNREEALQSKKKWFPYNKGGEFRKWYGNNDCVVNWSNAGYEIRNFKGDNGRIASRPQNMEYYFNESITWSKISSGSIAFRYKPYGHIFDVAGTSIFVTSNNKLKYILGLNNSIVINQILKATSPTLNYEVGQISNIPIIESNDKQTNDKIENIVDECVEDSKKDWDSFETSWDFKKHPLV